MSYDANGGTGAPAAQTKKHGTTLTLSSTKPTRTGYAFLGWAASKTATSAQYQPGGSYTANAAVTLYAVWKVNTYTVSYDANGGSGAPTAQAKTHGTALTLSSTKPTRTGYTFLGWAASKTATSAQYQPGGSYTANAAVTLYAVWKENAPTYATTLTVSSATASQGKEVSLNVSLAGNPGIIGINFQITYDKTRLKLIGYADGAMKDWSVGSTVTTQPTCTKDGVKTVKCTNSGCKETKTETVKALGHKWDDGKITTEPTCTEEGVKTISCMNSGCTETKTETVPALGHDWDEGTVTKEPTKKETGEKVLTCQNCGETETEVIPVIASTGAPVWLWIVIGVGVAAILLWIILAKRKKEDKEEAKR